jgi:hypothetical protein
MTVIVWTIDAGDGPRRGAGMRDGIDAGCNNATLA